MPIVPQPTLSTAFSYLERHNFSVVPLPPGRKEPPLVAWRRYQSQHPTGAQLRAWWHQHPTAGLAIVCGHISSLYVLDIDPRHGGDVSIAPYTWPAGPTVDSGGGGTHFYFRLNTSRAAAKHYPKRTGILPGVDFLGEGAYVVAPPSRHPSGELYRWRSGLSLESVRLPYLPDFVSGLLATTLRAEGVRVPTRWRPTSVNPAHLTLAQALARLEGVRQVGDQYFARCPAHPDETPSLSVGTGRDGRLLLHCFARCAFSDVLTALMRQEVAR